MNGAIWPHLVRLQALRRTTTDVPVTVPADREIDIFIGGYGNNITKPAETTATQFIVIEDIACSSLARWCSANPYQHN